jgi:hypothetical protein
LLTAAAATATYDCSVDYPPYISAKYFNKKVYDLLTGTTIPNTQKLGVIIMDFPSADLVKEVIKR